MARNKEKWDRTVQERIANDKASLIEQFKKMPILQVALERLSLSRSTYYHWRDTDPEFKKEADLAIAEGEAFITDMSESQLVSLIKDKHFPAVQLWLRKHHPKYQDRIELSGTLSIEEGELSEEEVHLLAQALKLTDVAAEQELNKNHEPRDPAS